MRNSEICARDRERVGTNIIVTKEELEKGKKNERERQTSKKKDVKIERQTDRKTDR